MDVNYKRELLKRMLEDKENALSSNISFGQLSILHMADMDNDHTQYNTGFTVKIDGELDVSALMKCIEIVQKRHDILRTVYIKNSAGYNPLIDNSTSSVDYDVFDVSKLCENEIRELIIRNNYHCFDLFSGPIYKCFIYKKNSVEHYFSFLIHHIAFDEWSSRILLNEIRYYYNRVAKEKNSDDYSSVVNQYSEFVKYQNKIFNRNDNFIFWHNYLQDHSDALVNLIGDNEIVSENIANVGSVFIYDIEPDDIYFIRNEIASLGVTAFHFFMSLFQVLISKYSDKHDVIIGIPVSCRTEARFCNTIGYFVNMLPMRSRIDNDSVILNYIKESYQNTLDVIEHEDYPFSLLVKNFCEARDGAGHPLFNIVYSYLNQKTLEDDIEKIGDDDSHLKFRLLDIPYQMNTYNIAFEVVDTNANIQLRVKYDLNRYSESYIEQFTLFYIKIIKSIISNPKMKYSNLHFVDEYSLKPFISKFNIDDTIYDAFKRIVSRFGQKEAVIYEGIKYTYADLDSQISVLSSNLSVRVPRNKRIGILVEKSPEMIIGILSILKLGCSYVPISPDWPAKRIDYVLMDSKLECIIADKQNYNKHKFSSKTIALYSINEILKNNNIDSQSISDRVDANVEAVVLYTSGSTGMPKGVSIKQTSVLNFVKESNVLPIKPEYNFVQLMNYAFDGSLFDIFGPLLNGCSLYLIPREAFLSNELLLKYLIDNHINVALFTTALFNELADTNPEFVKYLDYVIFGGELASVKHINQVFNYLKHKNALINFYGPTETTIAATFHVVKPADLNTKCIPIGSSVSGNYVLLLNSNKEMLPKYIPGEIYIGGAGVSNGYLNDNLNEKFIDNPYSQNEKIYASGDYGMFLSDYRLYFLGRKDNQIKLRGHRIELSEIEKVALTNEAILKAVALCINHNTEYANIVLFVESKRQINVDDLKIYLSEILPYYMVPSKIITIDKIPLTSNGKINKKELILYCTTVLKDNSVIIEGRTEEEKLLISIWKQYLKVDNIGIDDNFFKLGGHSLLAMRIISSIKAELGYDVNIKTFFDNPTIALLANTLCKKIEVEKIQLQSREKYKLNK